jgi:hypothetical protein
VFANAGSQASGSIKSSIYDNDLDNFQECGRKALRMFQKEVFLIKKLACKLKVDSSLHIMIEIIFCQAAPVLTPVHNTFRSGISRHPQALAGQW